MSTHTQTQWKIEPLIEALSTIDTSMEHVQADAAFIVRACNAHEAMLEALKNIPTECDHTHPHLMACWVCQVKEALRLAEGRL